MSSLTACDICGGPSWWCLDQSGQPWGLCQDDSCVSRVQLEMFVEEPVWGPRVGEGRERDAPIDRNPDLVLPF